MENHRILDVKNLELNKPYSAPYVSHRTDIFTGRIRPRLRSQWNSRIFTTDFRNAKSSRDRLDEVVITYLSFISNLLAHHKFAKTIIRPGAWVEDFSWNKIFKWVTFCVVNIIYDIDWKPEYFFFLDEVSIDLMLGKTEALRHFFTKIGITIEVPSFQVEEEYAITNYHSIEEFGQYYWRMLHWMAEAFPMRKRNNDCLILAKSMWREFTVQTLHRTLRCGRCSYHYNLMVSKYRSKLLECPDEELPMLWFEIHNEVNAKKFETHKEMNNKKYQPYSESEFSEDRKFMQLGLK